MVGRGPWGLPRGSQSGWPSLLAQRLKILGATVPPSWGPEVGAGGGGLGAAPSEIATGRAVLTEVQELFLE